jgi:hypothetical protein
VATGHNPSLYGPNGVEKHLGDIYLEAEILDKYGFIGWIGRSHTARVR